MTVRRRTVASLGIAIAVAAILPAPTHRGFRPPAPVALLRQAPGPPPADVTLRVKNQTAWAPRNSQWVLNLALTGAPAGSLITTRVFQSLTSRQGFQQSVNGTEPRGPLPAAQADLAPIPVDGLPPAGADGTRPVAIVIGMADTTNPGPGQVGLTQFGVHPVEVTVSDAGGRSLTRLVTHLVRLPDPGDALKPLLTAVVLPIGGPPAVTVDGQVGVSPQLRADINAPIDAVASRPDLPVTVAPTPETVDAVTQSSADLSTGALDRLRAALSGHHQVLIDTYVDLDTAAWVQAGMNTELGRQLFRGAAVVQDRAGLAPSGDAQRTDADVTPEALAWHRAAGARRVLVPDAALAPLDPDHFSRTLTRPFLIDAPGGGALSAVQQDSGLSDAFTRNPSDPALSAHQLLAELATLFTEDTGSVGGVVVAPPANGHPDQVFLDTLLDGLQQQSLFGQEQSPILAPVTLNELFDRLPLAGRTSTTETDGPRLTRTLTHTAAKSLGDFPQRLDEAHRLLDDYQSMLVEPSPRFAALQTRLLVAGADAFSSDERRRRVDRVQATVARQLNGIELPTNQTVTLAASDADIPLTIRNTTDQKLRVQVELSASKRLQFPPRPLIPEPLTPGESRRIKVRVHTLGSGVTPLLITVRTPSGLRLTDTRYRVQSTAVSGVGLVITIGAAGFLVLWWTSHWRRARHARRLDRHPASPSPGTA